MVHSEAGMSLEAPNSSPPGPAVGLLRRWNQALHSCAWWEEEGQWAYTETRVVQAGYKGNKEKPFPP